jgi:hypothetical protein
MSRPQKMHAPLPFTFKEVLIAVAAGNGVANSTPKSNPILKSSKAKAVRKKSK